MTTARLTRRTASTRRTALSRHPVFTRRTVRKGLLNLAGLLVALVTLFPVLWMISTAFKPPTEILTLTPHPIPLHPTLANFRDVINGSGIGMPYWTFLRNSLFLTIAAVVFPPL